MSLREGASGPDGTVQGGPLNGLRAVPAALVVSVLLIGSWPATVCDADTGWYDVVRRPPRPTVTVRWEARAHQDGLRLRLYRGVDAEHLELIADGEAVRGVGRYEYVATHPAAPQLVYQLRVVLAAGEESVLGTVLALTEHALPDRPTISYHHGTPAVLPDSPGCSPCVRSAARGSAVSQAVGLRPPPSIPPPR